jgi:hypothetical protein
MPEEAKEEEKKKLSPFVVIGAMGASVLSMVVSARLKTSGTIPGTLLGSGISTVGAFLIETRSQRAHARARAKIKAMREQDKVDAHPEKHPLQAQLSEQPLGRSALIHARAAREERKHNWGSGKRLAFLGGMLVLCVATAFGSLTLIEKAYGQTLHSVLTNQKQYGTTLGGYSSQKPVAPSVAPSVTYSPSSTYSPSPTFSASPTASATMTPSGTCTTPTCTAVSQ